MANVQYLLTYLCSASILLAAFFAIRFRKLNAFLRMLPLLLAAAFVSLLYFLYDDKSQLYGLGILAIALIFVLKDFRRHVEEQ